MSKGLTSSIPSVPPTDTNTTVKQPTELKMSVSLGLSSLHDEMVADGDLTKSVVRFQVRTRYDTLKTIFFSTSREALSK